MGWPKYAEDNREITEERLFMKEGYYKALALLADYRRLQKEAENRK